MTPADALIVLIILGFVVAYFLRDKSKDREKEDQWHL